MVATANFSVIGDTYIIVLDASFDLHAAGMDNSDIHRRAFEAGFRKAAEKLAIELNYIDITVINGTYEGPSILQQTENGDEGALWQEIHNRMVPARISIEISKDGVWAGQGTLTKDNEIVCSADLGSDVYEEIQDAIAQNESTCDVDGVSYSWDLKIAD